MSESMVERVAKAYRTFSVGGYDNHWNICRCDTDAGDFVEVVEVRSGSHVDALIYCNEMNARAAIAALRELTDDMVRAGIDADDKRTGNQTIRHIHRAMVDEALK